MLRNEYRPADLGNLAWKFDLALHGQDNERLLGSYGVQPVPAIKHFVLTTDLLNPQRLSELGIA